VFADKTILITGGTGSFGNAFLRRILKGKFGEVRIFSRDEKKQDEMRHELPNPRIKYFIGDVRNYDSVETAMRGVDYVFSAAALKQVPSCEFYPIEAVRTNILGTANVLDAAARCGVKRVVCLSTDKAVYPINAMGMSKALMEKTVIARTVSLPEGATILCCTRYGNVMASRGSVIPLFIEQMKKGAALTITDPEMTRFMMSLDEAIELVLYALDNAAQGDIYVKKAPGATIGDLARVLKDIFQSRSEIRIIGTRHGEKLFETLLSREEAVKAIDCGDYYRVPADTRGLDYGLYFTDGSVRVSGAAEYTSHTTRRLSREELRNLLLSVDYVSQQLNGRPA
jgi:UDP-N-acetylglucosamine 4,6-dehydratase